MSEQQMTMDQAHQNLIEMLDEVYQDLRTIHLDRTISSRNNSYLSKLASFDRISEQIFEFKVMLVDIEYYQGSE